MKKSYLKVFTNALFPSICALVIAGCSAAIPNYDAYTGDIKSLQKSLDEGKDIENPDFMTKQTRLMLAVYGEQMEAVKFLVEKGANINTRVEVGQSPLGIAVVLKNVDIAKYLIKNNGNIDYAIAGLEDWTKFCSNAFPQLTSCINKNQQGIIILKNLQLDTAWEASIGDYKNGHYQKSVDTLKQLIAKSPSPNQDYYTVLAADYNKMNQHKDAIAAANKSIEIKSNGSAYAVLGTIYETSKQYDKAISAYNKAITLGVDDYVSFALIHSQTGSYEEDIIFFTKSHDKEPNNISIHSKLATLYMKTGQYDQAIKSLDTIISSITASGLTKDTSYFFAQRSLAYREKGDSSNAKKDEEQASSLDLNHGTKIALAARNLDEGKYGSALQALSSVPKNEYFARILEATAYAKSGRYQESVDVYSLIPYEYFQVTSVFRENNRKTLLLALKPYVQIIKNQAATLLSTGSYKEAINEYTKALKISDKSDTKEVMSKISYLLKTNPTLGELPEEARKHARKAELFIQNSQLNEAVNEYQMAIKIAPYFPTLYKNIAINYASLKQYREAIESLKMYLSLSPDGSDARAAQDEIYKWEFLADQQSKQQ